MTDEITPSTVGRPTVLDEPTITKLEEILRIGGKIVAACAYAKIPPQTYYRNLKENDAFRDRMLSAQHYSIIAARSIVIKQMTDEKVLPEERTKLAQWWLEKHDIKQVTDGTVQNTQVNIFSELREKYMKNPEQVIEDQERNEEAEQAVIIPEPIKNE